MASDRKGEALEKLNRARKKLELLRMFGGDPKAVAREAKRIADEIRAAAREYAAALNSEGGDVSAAASAPVDASAAVTSVFRPALRRQQKRTRSRQMRLPRTLLQPSSRRPIPSSPAEPAQAYQDAAARVAAQANKDRGEQEVLAQFKDAAREAKRLIEEAVRKLKAKNRIGPRRSGSGAGQGRHGKRDREAFRHHPGATGRRRPRCLRGALAGVATADVGAPVVDILT